MAGNIHVRLSKLQEAQGRIHSLSVSDGDFTTKLRQVMQTLKDVTPADTVNVGIVDFRTRRGSYYALEGFLMPPGRRQLLPDFVDEHPMLKAAREGRSRGPLRFTDFYTRRKFEETALYRECYRGYTHSMMTFSVPSPHGLDISFALSRGDRDFSDLDKSMLALLQPMVSLFMENALLRAAIQMGGATEAAGLLLGSGSHAQYMNSQAEQLLRRYYPQLPPHSLPDELARSLNGRGVKRLTVQKSASRQLHVRLRGSFPAWTMMLVEEEALTSRSALSRSGLTGREVEVLEWVEQGKSNADIGIIFGISPRTVEKHLERIFDKLGVESRQAAARMFRELREGGFGNPES